MSALVHMPVESHEATFGKEWQLLLRLTEGDETKVPVPIFSFPFNHDLSAELWNFLNRTLSSSRNPLSVLKNSRVVFRTCSTRWLIPADFDTIFEKYKLLLVRWITSQNSPRLPAAKVNHLLVARKESWALCHTLLL